MVLAEWMDEHAADQRRVLLEERVAEPVDDAGHQVAGEVAGGGAEGGERPEGRGPDIGPGEPRRQREPQHARHRDRRPLHQGLPSEAAGMGMAHGADSTRKVAPREHLYPVIEWEGAEARARPRRRSRKFRNRGSPWRRRELASPML